MFTKFNECVYTKEQLLLLYKAWGATSDLPKVRQKIIVCFPGNEYLEVSRHAKPKDSDCKGALYKVEWFRAG